ncbi:MAG: hypothetical protein QXI05_04065 [Candidatus Bathyarchaeia archaeon]
MINKFVRDRRGQLVLILAIVMSMLILSVAFSIYQMTTQRSQLRYEQVKEILMAITSDLNRALAEALKEASEKYNSTQNYNGVVSGGENIIHDWISSLMMAYSPLGVKTLVYTPSNGSGRSSIHIYFDWNSELGVSYAYTDLELDIEAYGFEGWSTRSQKIVVLEIFPDSIVTDENESKVTMTFSVREDGRPISNLTPDFMRVYVHNGSFSWLPATIKTLNYIGGGNYTIEFIPSSNMVSGIKIQVITPISSIIVSAQHNSAFQSGQEKRNDEWRNLYLGMPLDEEQNEIMILPIFMWNNETKKGGGQTTPQISLGSEERNFFSPPFPCDISFNSSIAVRLYIESSSNKNKEVYLNVKISIRYHNGTELSIGEGRTIFKGDGYYEFIISTKITTIPKNSTVILTVRAESEKGFGTLHLYYMNKNDRSPVSYVVLFNN